MDDLRQLGCVVRWLFLLLGSGLLSACSQRPADCRVTLIGDAPDAEAGVSSEITVDLTDAAIEDAFAVLRARHYAVIHHDQRVLSCEPPLPITLHGRITLWDYLTLLCVHGNVRAELVMQAKGLPVIEVFNP